MIPKYSINTKKMTNIPNLISQSEPSAPKKIMVEEKIQTYSYIFCKGTRASVPTEKRIQIEKVI